MEGQAVTEDSQLKMRDKEQERDKEKEVVKEKEPEKEEKQHLNQELNVLEEKAKGLRDGKITSVYKVIREN